MQATQDVDVKTKQIFVVKRDGRTVKFNEGRIVRAVGRAEKDATGAKTDLGEIIAERVKRFVVKHYSDTGRVDIAKLQSIVEQELMKSFAKNVARNYIEFRSLRDAERAGDTDINVRLRKLQEKDKTIVNENANKDSNTFATERDLTAGTVNKVEGLKMLPPHVANAHLRGDIHYHDLDYQPYRPMTNCFARDTEFVTYKGIESFMDYEDGDSTVVLTPDGHWRNAVVRCYGKQQLNSVVLRKGSSASKEVHVTGNHRWILKDGTETTTLAVGDLLRAVAEPVRLNLKELLSASEEYILGWVQGFIYGDGSLYSKNGSRIRLCGEKSKYAPVFERAGFKLSSTAEYLNGDILLVNSKMEKSVVDDTASQLRKEAFINGWLEADGSFRNGNTDYKSVITIGKPSDIAHFKKLSAIAKYHIVGESDLTGQTTNFGTRMETTTLRLSHGNHFTWKVVDITENVYEDYVWCLEVEEEKAFTLAGGIPTGNCCLIDFEYMLKNGFKMGNAEIGSPHSIQTATAQTAQIIANVASSQYGGCSFDRIDEVLAPYAEMNYQKHMADAKRYRIPEPETYAIEKTNKDIYDAMQSLEYEINTLFTSNGQTPFTSIGFGLGTGRWEREIQKAIFKVRIQGLGTEGRTAIFPKLLFTIKDGVNRKPEDPNYEVKQLALECSAKRMYPDILNYDKIVELTGSFKCPMGCRSFLQGWKDEHGNEVNSGRMNLGVVTLNLPRIAIESEGDKEVFWEIFEERAKVLHDALVYRIERTYEAQPKNAPILYKHGAFGANLTDDDDVKQLFINNRATVSMGYIGLYEVASMFYGGDWQDKTDPRHEEAKEFALDVLRKLYDKKDEWTKETGIWFSIYSTPSESLTDRFCRMDTEKYGIIENITDKEYYTNSFHYDVRKSPTPFEKIDFEKEFPKYASGGFIHYVEYPKLVHNLKALEAVWDYSYDKVGYLGTNTPIDKCHECGFDGEFNPTSDGYECPQCGNNDPATCDVVKRTCGYLGNPQARPMPHGRKVEIDHRAKHM